MVPRESLKMYFIPWNGKNNQKSSKRKVDRQLWDKTLYILMSIFAYVYVNTVYVMYVCSYSYEYTYLCSTHALTYMQMFVMYWVSYLITPSLLRKNGLFESRLLSSAILAGQLFLGILTVFWILQFQVCYQVIQIELCSSHLHGRHLTPWDITLVHSLQLWKLFYIFFLLQYFVRKSICIHRQFSQNHCFKYVKLQMDKQMNLLSSL